MEEEDLPWTAVTVVVRGATGLTVASESERLSVDGVALGRARLALEEPRPTDPPLLLDPLLPTVGVVVSELCGGLASVVVSVIISIPSSVDVSVLASVVICSTVVIAVGEGADVVGARGQNVVTATSSSSGVSERPPTLTIPYSV